MTKIELIAMMNEIANEKGFTIRVTEKSFGIQNLYFVYPNGYWDRSEIAVGIGFFSDTRNIWYFSTDSIINTLDNYLLFREVTKEKEWRYIHFFIG